MFDLLQFIRNFKEAKDFEQFIGNLNVYKTEINTHLTYLLYAACIRAKPKR